MIRFWSTLALSVSFAILCAGQASAPAPGNPRSGSDDPAKIAVALKDGKPVDTVMGPVRFDSKGDILDPRYDINMWSAGKYAPIAQ